jgi:hypothetical protein
MWALHSLWKTTKSEVKIDSSSLRFISTLKANYTSVKNSMETLPENKTNRAWNRGFLQLSPLWKFLISYDRTYQFLWAKDGGKTKMWTHWHLMKSCIIWLFICNCAIDSHNVVWTTNEDLLDLYVRIPPSTSSLLCASSFTLWYLHKFSSLNIEFTSIIIGLHANFYLSHFCTATWYPTQNVNYSKIYYDKRCWQDNVLGRNKVHVWTAYLNGMKGKHWKHKRYFGNSPKKPVTNRRLRTWNLGPF